MKRHTALSDTDADAALREAVQLLSRRTQVPARRAFLQRSLTLGGVALLGGCSISDNASVETALKAISRFNDRAQGWLFDPTRLAPTYDASLIARPFPFNAYYGLSEVRHVDGAAWRMEVTGLVADKRPWTLGDLVGMPQQDQITRHVCVEGWSAIGRWGGVRFSDFLKKVGADTTAKYVDFHCADNYRTSIDMPTAMHPQTTLAISYDGETLPAKYGYPVRLRMPTKLGYKNPKHIVAISVTNTYPGGYWEDQGYNWFGGS